MVLAEEGKCFSFPHPLLQEMLQIPGGLFLIMTHYLVQYWHHMDAISVSLCDHMTRCFEGNRDSVIFSLVTMFEM